MYGESVCMTSQILAKYKPHDQLGSIPNLIQWNLYFLGCLESFDIKEN
jgi:hypothetical protein